MRSQVTGQCSHAKGNPDDSEPGSELLQVCWRVVLFCASSFLLLVNLDVILEYLDKMVRGSHFPNSLHNQAVWGTLHLIVERPRHHGLKQSVFTTITTRIKSNFLPKKACPKIRVNSWFRPLEIILLFLPFIKSVYISESEDHLNTYNSSTKAVYFFPEITKNWIDT